MNFSSDRKRLSEIEKEVGHEVVLGWVLEACDRLHETTSGQGAEAFHESLMNYVNQRYEQERAQQPLLPFGIR